MSKILKNTTLSDIEIPSMGVTVPASGELVIESTDYLLLGLDDTVTFLNPLISSGDIVINDGTTDLSIPVGALSIESFTSANRLGFFPEALASNDFSADNIQDGIEEARDTSFKGLLNGYIEDESETSTTSTSYVTKLTLTTDTLPAGDYTIGWTGDYKTANGSSKKLGAKIDVDDSTILNELTQTDTKGQFTLKSGFRKVTLTAGVHNIRVKLKKISGTATARSLRLQIWRIS